MPVINPVWFYVMSLCDPLKDIFIICFMFGMGLGISGYLCGVDERDKSIGKKLIVFGIIALLLGVAIPSEKTVTKMIIADNITYERLEKTTDTIEKVYEDIIEVLDNKGKD